MSNIGKPGTEPGFDAIAAAAELDEAMSDANQGASRGDGGDRYIRMLELDIENLNALVAEKERQRQEAVESARRAHDEIATARLRLERDARREAEARFRDALLGFLGVLDNLDRALAAATTTGNLASVLDGIRLVRNQFLGVLASHGVTPIVARGAQFDPTLHEAMSAIAARDHEEHGRVIDVLREGYAIGDEVLRPAGVIVAMKR